MILQQRGTVCRSVHPFLFLLTILVLFSCFLRAQESAAPAAASPEPVQIADPASFPQVVARVNGSAIDRQELLDRVEAVKQRMHLPAGDTPLQVYRLVLSELVEFELLVQASAARNSAATAAEVETEFQQLQAQFPSPEAFQQQLAAESMTAERLKEMLRKDLSVQKYVETNLATTVVVSEEEKRKFYTENPEAMQQPERLRLRHILNRVAEGASPEAKAAVRARVEQLRAQAEQGADFAELARNHSDDPASREAGGEMTIARGQTVDAFEQAAFALQPGALSPVVETRFGYHIIRLEERLPARQVPFEEVEARIQQFLQQEAVQKKVEQEIEVLKSSASIEVLI